MRGGDFSLLRLLRLFGCWSSTPTRKKSYERPRDLKPCGLLCSPMAKVERREPVRKVPGVPETWPHEGPDGHFFSAPKTGRTCARRATRTPFRTVSKGQFCELRTNGVL